MESTPGNKVQIKFSGPALVEYISNSFVITEKQPSYPPPIVFSDNEIVWGIEIKCGRKGSSGVAGQFINMSGGTGHTFCPTAKSDRAPRDLNFYLGIKVRFSVNSENYYANIYLGQGHSDNRNNWWVGSPNIINTAGIPGALMILFSQNMEGVAQVFSITGGVSDFLLRAQLSL
jgi:hypothetical protein